MTLANTDSSVTLTFRVREQVTPALSRMEAGLGRVGNAALASGKALGQNSLQLVALGGALIGSAGVLSDLAVRYGLLDEAQGAAAQTFISTIGAISGIAGALAGLGTFLAVLAPQLGVTAGALATIGSVAVVAAGAVASLVTVMQILSGQETTLEKFTNVNLGQTNRAGRLGNLVSQATPSGVAAGGSRFGGREGPGTQVIINLGNLIADETGLRDFTKRIGRILQEESRIGGFQLN